MMSEQERNQIDEMEQEEIEAADGIDSQPLGTNDIQQFERPKAAQETNKSPIRPKLNNDSTQKTIKVDNNQSAE